MMKLLTREQGILLALDLGEGGDKCVLGIVAYDFPSLVWLVLLRFGGIISFSRVWRSP
jgi:hypothetical protein